jgi:hypothetical protein
MGPLPALLLSVAVLLVTVPMTPMDAVVHSAVHLPNPLATPPDASSSPDTHRGATHSLDGERNGRDKRWYSYRWRSTPWGGYRYSYRYGYNCRCGK